MTSKPNHTNSEQDVSKESDDGSSASEEDVVSVEQTESTSTETEEIRIELPEPDAENIAVLTDKLPNKPILPWNRYDSPWEEPEIEHKPESESQENTDQPSHEATEKAPQDSEKENSVTVETRSDEEE
jgi:hypothetical protein